MPKGIWRMPKKRSRECGKNKRKRGALKRPREWREKEKKRGAKWIKGDAERIKKERSKKTKGVVGERKEGCQRIKGMQKKSRAFREKKRADAKGIKQVQKKEGS
jgi:hypothetical protein